MPSKKLDARLEAAKEVETAPDQHATEAAVLATLLTHANSDESDVPHAVLSQLREVAFERADHRAIYRAVVALREAGDGIDRVTLRARLTGKVADLDLEAVYAAPTLTGPLLRSYVARLADRARLRAVEDVARDVLGQAQTARTSGDALNASDALARLQVSVFDADRTSAIVRHAPSEADQLEAFRLDLEARESPKGFVGLDTGFRHLNHVLNGLTTGLYVFAGPPGCGKTTFLKQLADQLADVNRVPVLFLSFEQSAEELRVKSLARLSGQDTRDILKGRTSAIWPHVERAFRDYGKVAGFLYLVEADRDTTIGAIRLLAQTVRQRAHADRVVLILDYLQIVPVESPKDFPSTKDRVDWLCAELRRLARDLQSPVLAISSENREAYKNSGKPTLAAFKESGGIEYSADVAGAFWTNKEGPRTGEPGDRAVTLTLLKNRFGETAELDWTFVPKSASFFESDDEPNPITYADTLKD